MKKSFVLTAVLVGILLAAWVIFKPSTSSSQAMAAPVTGKDIKVAPVFDTTGAIVSDPMGTLLNGHRLQVADFKVAPVFDTTGAIVSDPMGTVLNGHRSPGANFKVAPVFDTTGAIVSDPTGTILSVSDKP